jgi:hypothetical protein
VSLLLLLVWLLTSVTVTTGSPFSTSTSSMMGLFLPLSLAAFFRRRLAGRSQKYAVTVIKIKRAAMPPTMMAAMMGVERAPMDAVMVIDGSRLVWRCFGRFDWLVLVGLLSYRKCARQWLNALVQSECMIRNEGSVVGQ